MQQRRRLSNVGFVGSRALDRMHQSRGNIDADMRLHPEVPLIALLGLMHLRVTALLLVLGRGRSGNDGGIDDRAPAFAGAGFGASISRAPPASPILRRTMLGSTRAAPANGGNSGLSSPPELPLPPDRYRQSRARLGCHRAHPPSPRRPAHTTAAGSGSAASAPDQSAVGRARPSDRKVADAPPAAPTARPAPSRPKTCRAASASSCRRIPPAKSFPEAASPGPSVPAPADSTLSGPQPGYFFGVSLAVLQLAPPHACCP